MPLVSQTFDQLLDFTRTSAATFVGSNGLIQTTPASVNLLTWTQQFDNAAWTKSNTTVTANSTVAPDGTSTADTLIENTSNAFHAAVQSLTLSGATTISCYLKANTRNFAAIRTYDGTNGDRYAVFNLATGAAGVTSGGTTSTITSVGNGWYRCSMTYTYTSASGSAGITVQDANSYVAYTGDGTSGVYLWGAQVEVGSAATTYTRNNGGVFPPRFDYDPVTLAPKGLLIEEQRTNLLVRSEEFDNAAWVKLRATVTANATTSPDGTVDADKLVEDTTASNTHIISQTATIAASTSYTFCVYLKAGERTFARLLFGDAGGNNGVRVDVNLSNGATSTSVAGTGWVLTAASATAVGNGWYRVVLTGANTSATAGIGIIYLASALGTISYTGDGTSGIYLWGAQVEAGAFATSYIPTVASQVTRTADQCSIVAPNFAPWYNQSEGSFVVEADSSSATGVASTADDGGFTNRIQVGTSSTVTFFVTSGGTTQAELALGGIGQTPARIAVAYKQNDFAGSRNGASALTDTSGSVPTVNRFGIGSVLGLAYINGHIRSIRYYPTRLTNAQLQALTA